MNNDPCAAMTRVLIVEDDAAIRTNIARLLKLEGYGTAVAERGEEGLARARELRPDVVISDISMPGMDGFALLEAIRSEPALATTAVIMLTALDDRTTMRRGMTAGADDFLGKPFTRDELIEALDGLLKKRGRMAVTIQSAVSFDALHDRLTGLPNRVSFREQLGQMLGGEIAQGTGVLVAGVDGFRALNEKHGMDVGDGVLVEAARCLRMKENRPLASARIGPDIFGVSFFGNPDEAQELAQWVQQCLQQSFDIAGHPLQLTVSVGWALTSQGPAKADDLLTAAEDALARAKSRGRGRIHSFNPAEQVEEQGRRWTRENIDLALSCRDQFELHYQPFVRLSDRALLGFEALIRWRHPTRGMVMPGDFISVAEASGQIVSIGRWTMLEAAGQLQRWHAIDFRGEIAVNLSGVQVERDAELLVDARDTLAALGPVPPHRLKLEITESMAMANPQRSAEVLRELAGMGFKLSIDDFGTGYSSLSYLHRFPFDTLKIDRSFVLQLAAGREAQEIVRTIVGVAVALGKQTIAEGVEEEAQAGLLEQLGVQEAQGWLFANALPVPQAQMLIGAAPWRRP